MATGEALNGKPYAGNPHVAPSQCYGGTSRFDMGEAESAVRPRCGSLLYNVNRRDFLSNTLALGATVAAAGCVNARNKLTGFSGAPMQGFADKPFSRVRVGDRKSVG